MSDGAAVHLYTPWREGHAALAERHVGRVAELEAIRSAARAFASGASPLPLYLFGPSGAGKSHLLTLARATVEAATPAAEVAVTVMPEDTIEMRSAADLFSVMHTGVDASSWRRWREPAAVETRGDTRRRVVLFEGLDRQLRALGVQGRRELRRLLGDGPPTWIVGAGMTLPDELTAADEAFFGAFDPWPLEGLAPGDAGALLDRIAGRSEEDALWRPVRAALITLAGGSPRTLAALGLACRETQHPTASEILRLVTDRFTSQYRSQLRELAPQAQRMVVLLSAAPRELAPSELAAVVATSTTQMSVQARRLVDEGVLRHRSDGRQTWYRLADPLFRFWLEYRNAPWTETRAGWVANLLPCLSLPTALDRDTPLPSPARELEEALRTHTSSPRDAFVQFLSRLDGASHPGLPAVLAQLFARLPGARPWLLRPPERRLLAAQPYLRAMFLGQGRLWSHPPLIAPEDVVEAPGPLPDAAELLSMALERRHPALLRAAAPHVTALPPCHRPLALDAESAAAIAAMLLRALVQPSAPVFANALGWAAALADVPDVLFGSLLTRFRATARLHAHGEDHHHDIALATLLGRAPPRFEQLAEVLAQSHGPAVERARLLHEQLAEQPHGELHTELAVLAEALAPA